MSDANSTLDKVIDQIGFLLNSVDPTEEINKMMALELTITPNAHELPYKEIMNKVVVKLVNFYQDQELEQLWTQYLLEVDEEEIFDDAA